MSAELGCKVGGYRRADLGDEIGGLRRTNLGAEVGGLRMAYVRLSYVEKRRV